MAVANACPCALQAEKLCQQWAGGTSGSKPGRSSLRPPAHMGSPPAHGKARDSCCIFQKKCRITFLRHTETVGCVQGTNLRIVEPGILGEKKNTCCTLVDFVLNMGPEKGPEIMHLQSPFIFGQRPFAISPNQKQLGMAKIGQRLSPSSCPQVRLHPPKHFITKKVFLFSGQHGKSIL